MLGSLMVMADHQVGHMSLFRKDDWVLRFVWKTSTSDSTTNAENAILVKKWIEPVQRAELLHRLVAASGSFVVCDLSTYIQVRNILISSLKAPPCTFLAISHSARRSSSKFIGLY